MLVGLLALSTEQAFADVYDDEQVSRPKEGEQEQNQGVEEGSPSAGGLEAPGQFQPQQGRSAMEDELARSDQKDSERGLQFFHLDLLFAPQVLRIPGRGTESGFGYGAGIGIRAIYLTLGFGFQAAQLPSYYYYSLTGDLNLRFPLGHWEPYAGLSLGYAGLSRGDTTVGLNQRLGGFAMRLRLGGDYYFSHTFSLGVRAAFDQIFLGQSVVVGGRKYSWGITPALVIGFHL
ncbi:MAG: hypothetical protein MK135_12055 [Polyangiaceae bacterium]|nr:hypothetical protein [Polyangiaceae bacterium]